MLSFKSFRNVALETSATTELTAFVADCSSFAVGALIFSQQLYELNDAGGPGMVICARPGARTEGITKTRELADAHDIGTVTSMPRMLDVLLMSTAVVVMMHDMPVLF
jgi:hypothetical protein